MLDVRSGAQARSTMISKPEPKPEEPPEYFYYSTLIKRGWTRSQIKSLLGQHDKEGKNPHYRSGPPSRLFLRTRVIEAEQANTFKSAQTDREKRSEAAVRAVETKRKKIQETFESLSITLPRLSQEELVKHAVYNRNAHIPDWKIEQEETRLCRVEDLRPWSEADPFRDRICVNYLRHSATSYDRLLRMIEGRVGKDEARQILRRKVYTAIAEAYPYLKDEAERQIERRNCNTV
jgi:hypothetical protein